MELAEEKIPKLGHNEIIVLDALVEVGGTADGLGFIGFARIMDDTKLDRRIVRRACRSLARKGLAVYAKGLWNCDGEPRGAGYAATERAVELFGKPPYCIGCYTNRSDPPSPYCPGCQAYKEHQQ